MWNAIVQFLSTVIEFFYGLTGNFGIAVILFTLCVRLLILPLDIKSKKSTAKIQSLNPQIQKINEKYKNDPDKKNKKIQELYRDNNVSPFGGCLPLLITLPVLFLLFAALRKIASENHFELLKTILINADGSMEGFLAEIQTLVDNAVAAGNIKVSFQDILPTLFNNPGGELAKNMSAFPSIISQEKYDILINAIKAVDSDMAMQTIKETGCNFLWIKNIWIADSPLKTILGAKTAFSFTNALANGWFVLPVVAGVTTYLQTWITTPKKSKANADPNQNTMGLMNKIFPFMSLYFCAMYNSAFAIYWVLANLIQIAQTLVMQWIQNNKKKKSTTEKSVL